MEVDLLAEHPLGAYRNIGLNVLDEVADMKLPVRVGQGSGHDSRFSH
jgi:hypothetical protein